MPEPFLIAPDLWTLHYPLSVFGLIPTGRVVTIIRLPSGHLILHSTAPFSSGDITALGKLGQPGWLVEAMLLHDTYAQDGRRAFPAIPYLAPPGFAFAAEVDSQPLYPSPPEWKSFVSVFPVEGAPRYSEYVLLHHPTKTLIVADLLFNFDAASPAWFRRLFRWVNGIKDYPAMSKPFRWSVRDVTAFARSMDRILAEDFERIIVGHGAVIEADGKSKLAAAVSAVS